MQAEPSNTPDLNTSRQDPAPPGERGQPSEAGSVHPNGIPAQSDPGAKSSTVQPRTDPTDLPSPTTFGFTTSQAVMTLVTLIGAILVVQSLRRMNSKKPKEARKRKPTGDLSELTALRNEIYAKYPPPPKAVNTNARGASRGPDPQLRLVDDRGQAGSHAAEIAALRAQVEQLGTEVSHLRSRIHDLESNTRSAQIPIAADLRARHTDSQPPAPSTDHEKVYRLADRGMNAVEIAKTLGQHTGQVELILNLRRATGS